MSAQTTINRASVEHGARLAAEATPGPWSTAGASFRTPAKVVGHAAWGAEASYADAAFIAHWNPEFAAELARELQRLWRVEEAARAVDAEHQDGRASFRVYKRLRAALANPAAEEGE